MRKVDSFFLLRKIIKTVFLKLKYRFKKKPTIVLELFTFIIMCAQCIKNALLISVIETVS